MNKLLYLSLLIGLVPISSMADRQQGIAAPAFVSFDAIPVCYDFGCKSKSTVRLPITEW